jgi:hypothetical protein
MMRAPITLALAAALGFALAGCGKQGDLDRPAPLWGAKAKAQYEAEQRAATDAKSHSPQDNQIESLPEEEDNGVADNAAAAR